MQHVAVRLLTEWLKRDASGVNEKLAAIVSTGTNPTLDLDKDSRPTAVGYIGSEVDDQIVAENREPPAYPALYVTEDGPMAMAGETPTDTHRDTLPGEGLPVAIRILQQVADRTDAVQARGYIQRAIMQSLQDWLSPVNEAFRCRSGIQVVAAERFMLGRWRETVGAAKVTAVVVVTLSLRDFEV